VSKDESPGNSVYGDTAPNNGIHPTAKELERYRQT
jgi:hypothetical protein